jgi:hypothetical protein
MANANVAIWWATRWLRAKARAAESWAAQQAANEARATMVALGEQKPASDAQAEADKARALHQQYQQYRQLQMAMAQQQQAQSPFVTAGVANIPTGWVGQPGSAP